MGDLLFIREAGLEMRKARASQGKDGTASDMVFERSRGSHSIVVRVSQILPRRYRYRYRYQYGHNGTGGPGAGVGNMPTPPRLA